MRGAIIGDIIGSAFIESPQVTTDFQLLKPFSAYTDDTILTLATADAILKNIPYADSIRQWTKSYPKAGYRPAFLEWALSDNPEIKYQSSGDGAARRVSPIGFAAKTLDEALQESKKATIITHPSIAKIKASQAIAGSVFLAKSGKKKDEIKDFLSAELGYHLPDVLEKNCVHLLHAKYESPAPCAIMAFLNSDNFEDAIRKAIWLNGPSNTIACITGGLAQAYYGHIPKSILRKTLSRLSTEIADRMIAFEKQFCQQVILSKKEINYSFD